MISNSKVKWTMVATKKNIHLETTITNGNEGTTSLIISGTSNENTDVITTKDSDKKNGGNKGIIYLEATKKYGNEGTTNLSISGLQMKMLMLPQQKTVICST